jgi:hypothetical protein
MKIYPAEQLEIKAAACLEISVTIICFVVQSTFMVSGTTSLDALQDIKKMMEKSSRFISLSGWSGIAAGIFGLAGAYFAQSILNSYAPEGVMRSGRIRELEQSLFLLAAAVFIGAFTSAFIFTYIRSRREGIAIWGTSARRLLWNTMLPMVVGGVVILRLVASADYDLIAPCTLIFYGLGVINGSKYTLGEIRYMGYLEVLLGLISLWLPGYGLLMWAIGFGLLHIIYGIIMWWKHERK